MSETTEEETEFHIDSEYGRGFLAGAEAAERRIIEALENESRNCEKAGLWANGPELRQQLQDLHLGLNAAIELIKGEKK